MPFIARQLVGRPAIGPALGDDDADEMRGSGIHAGAGDGSYACGRPRADAGDPRKLQSAGGARAGSGSVGHAVSDTRADPGGSGGTGAGHSAATSTCPAYRADAGADPGDSAGSVADVHARFNSHGGSVFAALG